MPAKPYAAIATIPTPDGLVYVRKSWSAKQGSFLLILDGSNAALSLLLPDWRSRSQASTRTQVTPPESITTAGAIQAYAQTLIPTWLARAQGNRPVVTDVKTFGDCVKATTKVLANTIRPSSLIAYQKQWRRLTQSIPNSTPLNTISRETVQTLVGNLAARGSAATTIRNAITALHRALTPALDAGVVSPSVFQHLSVPRAVAKTRQHLTREQRDRVLAVAAGAGRNIHLLISIGLLAGLRRAELLALTWADIDLTAQVLKVRNRGDFKTKSGKNRVVPICQPLQLLLMELRPADVDATAYVIKPEKAARLKGMRWAFSRTFRKVTAQAGVPWLSPHGMRRAFATMAVQSGVSVWKVKAWLGHSSVTVTERSYTADLLTFDPDVNKVG